MNSTETAPYRVFSDEDIKRLADQNHWDADLTRSILDRAAAHYYVTPKTGHRYRDGKYLRSINHWDRKEPLHIVMEQTKDRTPLVQMETGLGNGALYRLEDLRALAATLNRIADDAAVHPMGPRSFHRSDRGYDVVA